MAFLLHIGQVAGKGGEETAKSEVAAAAEEEAREREAQHDGLHHVHDAERSASAGSPQLPILCWRLAKKKWSGHAGMTGG